MHRLTAERRRCLRDTRWQGAAASTVSACRWSISASVSSWGASQVLCAASGLLAQNLHVWQGGQQSAGARAASGRGGRRRRTARGRSTHQGSSSARLSARSAGTRRHFSQASHCTWQGRGGADRSVGGGGGAAALCGGEWGLWGGGAALRSPPWCRGSPLAQAHASAGAL